MGNRMRLLVSCRCAGDITLRSLFASFSSLMNSNMMSARDPPPACGPVVVVVVFLLLILFLRFPGTPPSLHTPH